MQIDVIKRLGEPVRKAGVREVDDMDQVGDGDRTALDHEVRHTHEHGAPDEGQDVTAADYHAEKEDVVPEGARREEGDQDEKSRHLEHRVLRFRPVFEVIFCFNVNSVGGDCNISRHFSFFSPFYINKTTGIHYAV